MLSVYTASKAAVEAFTECLALELEPFEIRVRLVIPGRSPETQFRENAQRQVVGGVPHAYADFAQNVFAAMARPSEVTRPVDVAEAVWRAVNDALSPIRIPAGADAVALAASR
jgi:NAD(P)-dependent dehydrogenase (short-subunit alcohol dehydrogenase family)